MDENNQFKRLEGTKLKEENIKFNISNLYRHTALTRRNTFQKQK